MSQHDYVIVGAGITGCYLAWRLNQLYPHKTILILEGSSIYGGRLVSIPWDETIAEMGAWRYRSSHDFHLVRLIQLLGLTGIPLNLPRIREPPQSLKVQHIIDVMNTNIQDIAFIPFLYSQGATTKEILQYIDYLGYDIYRGDIVTSLIREPNGGYSYIQEGYRSLCTRLLQQMNSNVNLQLNSKVNRISPDILLMENGQQIQISNLIVTVQPQNLAQIYQTTESIIASSMIPYNAIRLWCKIDKDIPIGTYVSISPLRKIYAVGNRRILIYVDGAYAQIIPQLLRLVPSIIDAKVIYQPKPIYKYWVAGIMFWRPRGQQRIYKMLQNLPFSYLNGDVSQRPGWVEGSLQLVNNWIESTVTGKPAN